MSVETELNEYYDIRDGIQRYYPQYIQRQEIAMHLELVESSKQRIITLIEKWEDKYEDG